MNTALLKTYIWTPRSTFYNARELSYTLKWLKWLWTMLLVVLGVSVHQTVLNPVPINSAWSKTYIWTPRSTFYDARRLRYQGFHWFRLSELCSEFGTFWKNVPNRSDFDQFNQFCSEFDQFWLILTNPVPNLTHSVPILTNSVPILTNSVPNLINFDHFPHVPITHSAWVETLTTGCGQPTSTFSKKCSAAGESS